MSNKVTIDLSTRTVFTVLGSLFLVWLAYLLRDILVLFFVSFILATALEPIVNNLERKKLPRIIAIGLMYSVVFAFVFILFRLIIPPITEQVRHLVDNKDSIFQNLEVYMNRLPLTIREPLDDFWVSVPDRIKKYADSGAAVSGAFGVFSGLLGAITVFVISFYLLLEKGTVEGLVTSYWPKKSRAKAHKNFKKIVGKVSLWARGQLMLSGAVGILTYLGLSILGVDYAMTLALIAALTELFPLIGPIIGAIPAVIIAFTLSPLTALWVVLLYVGTQQFESHVLVPQVMKRAVGLSPVAIILSIMIGAKLLGFLGVVIAVPVASAVVVLLQSMSEEGE